MIYKVTKQYSNGRESQDKSFSTLQAAETHAQTAAQSDASMKIKVIYRIYEFEDVIKEINSEVLMQQAANHDPASASSSGKGQSSSFKPTPLSTRPRPKGGPEGWLKDDESNDTDENS